MKRHLVLLCVLLLGLPRLLWAGYQFHTIDMGFPGASATVVTGLNHDGLAVGLYQDANRGDQGFVQTPGGRTTVLLNVTPQAVTPDLIVGWFRGPMGTTQGFALRAGTFTAIPGPFVQGQGFPRLVEPLDANEAGRVVGSFRSQVDDQVHGFVYESTTGQFTQVDIPGATSTTLTGINSLGQQVGSATDAAGQRFAFRREGTTVDIIPIPGLPDADLVGLTTGGRFAGNSQTVGFVLEAGAVEVLTAPDATLTELFGIRDDGAVYGRFVTTDGTEHGFVALPDGSPLGLTPRPRPRLQAFELITCRPGSKRPRCQGQD
jgi:hypothetical protein